MSDSEFAYTGTENLEIMQYAPKYNQALCMLVRTHAPTDGGDALDFGAGIGTFSQCLRHDGITVHCLEPDNKQRQQLALQGFPTFADISEIADQLMDYAFSLNVLEHIEDDLQACRELYRVVRPGGHLMIYVPAFQILFTRMDEKVGHVRRYDRKRLTHCLTTAGFVIEKATYYDFLGFFATLLVKLFASQSDGSLNPRFVHIYDTWTFPLSRLLSRPFGWLLGKNLMVYAKRPESDDAM